METVVQQVMEAMEEEDDDNILRVSESSESNLSDEDDMTYVAPALESCYLDNKVVIGPLYSTNHKSESEKD